MKQLVLFLLLSISAIYVSAQERFTINGKTYELKTEVEGEIDLLWNTIDKEYRYFIRTNDGNFIELLNTKGSDNKYQEEYKAQLSRLTENSASTNNLNFTLPDIKGFVQVYNTSFGNTYLNNIERLKLRLGIFGGITNQPFVSNPNNTMVPFFGAEIEGLSSSKTSNQAGFLSIIHALDNNDFKYSSTQIGIGYRYRFINKSNFNIYGNLKIATYTFSKETIYITDTTNEVFKESSFQIPCSFGLGADIKISNGSFITLAYNNLFAIFLNNSNNFPMDFALGLKFSL